MKRLVVASRSAHKVEELRRLVAPLLDAGLLEVVSVADLEAETGAALPEVEEDAPDFAGNAEKKARAIAEHAAALALGDDSGLCVDALEGGPGVYSARYSGAEGEWRDAANNEKLLAELAEVPEEERGASFVCALALVAPDGRVWQVEGRCHGRIAEAPRGAGGFGYESPLREPGARSRRAPHPRRAHRRAEGWGQPPGPGPAGAAAAPRRGGARTIESALDVPPELL